MNDFIEVHENEIEIPKIVFKHRKWDGFQKDVILKREVFYAPPESFEDPLDCKVPIRYDQLTDEEIFGRYLERMKEQHPRWTRLKQRSEARYWFNKGLMRDKEHIQKVEEDYWKEFNERFGVLCLIPNPNSFKMWVEYSDNHKGYCVGFNTEIMFKDKSKVGGGGKVIYFGELPIIHPLEPPMQKMLKQIYFKEKKWEFEDEFRVHKMHPNQISDEQRILKVPEEALAEIIFGAKMPPETKTEIIEIAKTSCKHAVFKQAVINADSETISIVDY
ncbi:MAG: DUF2971 domain-containing protein [Saprospiraceae bacterium]|nr:DUF2971 domain-containing protein [Saprospiraceae bacterium]